MMIELILEAETGEKNMTWKEKVRHTFPRIYFKRNYLNSI